MIFTIDNRHVLNLVLVSTLKTTVYYNKLLQNEKPIELYNNWPWNQIFKEYKKV